MDERGGGGSGRRDFLVNFLLAISVIPGLGLATKHVLGFLIPRRRVRENEIMVAKLSEIPLGEAISLKDVLGHDLNLVRHGEKEIKALSSICTHLGCHVEWQPGPGTFCCPGHKGVFSAGGEVLAGPPPRPLESYPVRVDDNGYLYVTVPTVEA